MSITPEVWGGPRTLSMHRDREGHREYQVKYLVRADRDDGPASVILAIGLPQYGDYYNNGTGDIDIYALCKQDADVKVHEEKEGDPANWWSVTLTFSTRCESRRCRTTDIQNPLDTLPEIAVSFVRYTEEATVDFQGNPIVTSSHEFIRGPQNEWDMCRMQIKIKQNVIDPQLDALCQMVDTVNKFEIWGFPPRTVKLSEAPVEWKFCGSCDGNCYYERLLTFDVRYRAKVGVTQSITTTGTGTEIIQRLVKDTEYDTFDRLVLDEGTKVLNGHWDASGNYVLDKVGGMDPDPANPQHFIRYQDRAGNNTRVILDGAGMPANTLIITGSESGTSTAIAQAGRKLIQFYGESDFALLERLPTSLVPIILP